MAKAAKKKVEAEVVEEAVDEDSGGLTEFEGSDFLEDMALGDDDLDADVPEEAVEEVKEEETTQEEVVKEEEPVAEAVEPEPTPEPEPEPAPVEETLPEPVQPEVVPEPSVEPAPQLTQEQAEQHWSALRDRSLAELTQFYKIPEAMAEELEEHPLEATSKLLAQVHYNTATSVVQQLMQVLPQAIRSVQQQEVTTQDYETRFFEAWPGLDSRNKEHVDTIVALGQAYRHLRPNAPADEFITNVGAQAVVALRVPQLADASPKSEPSPEAKPFKPAATGSRAGATPKSDNQFTVLDEEMFGVDDMDLD